MPEPVFDLDVVWRDITDARSRADKAAEAMALTMLGQTLAEAGRISEAIEVDHQSASLTSPDMESQFIVVAHSLMVRGQALERAAGEDPLEGRGSPEVWLMREDVHVDRAVPWKGTDSHTRLEREGRHLPKLLDAPQRPMDLTALAEQMWRVPLKVEQLRDIAAQAGWPKSSMRASGGGLRLMSSWDRPPTQFTPLYEECVATLEDFTRALEAAIHAYLRAAAIFEVFGRSMEQDEAMRRLDAPSHRSRSYDPPDVTGYLRLDWIIEVAVGFAAVKVLGPFLEAFSKKLGEQLGESVASALGRIRFRRWIKRGPQIDVAVPGADRLTTLLLPQPLDDTAKLAIIDLDLTSDDVAGSTLRWDPATKRWEQSDPSH